MPKLYCKYIIEELQNINKGKEDYTSYFSNNNQSHLTKVLSSDNPEEIKIKGEF